VRYLPLQRGTTSAISTANITAPNRKSSFGKTDRDPILVLAKWLIELSYADAASLDRITAEVRATMESAVKFAIAAPYPNVDEVEKHVYCLSVKSHCTGSA